VGLGCFSFFPVTTRALNLHKNKHKQDILMPAYYATRRMTGSSSSSNAWMRNRNVVRHNSRIVLGPVGHTITIVMIVLLTGLIFLTQSTKVTNYDVEIAKADEEIVNLEAQRDALAVENAKITAAAADEDRNSVAAAMVNANSADFVKE